MKKTSIYLHIGMPKTGTSALQRFFYENRSRLMQTGIFYPMTGLEGWAHHYFPASINGRNFKTEISFPHLLEKVLSDTDFSPEMPILLSSEAFHNLRQGTDIQILQKGLKNFDVKIIVYLRRQDDWVQSAYNQTVKSHRNRFTGTAEEYAYRKHLNKILDYSKFLKKWELAFGLNNINVRVYEKNQMPDGIFQDFMNIFNIRINNTYNLPPGKINPSLTPAAVNILRRLNRVPMTTKMHNGFVKILLKASPWLYKKAKSESQFFLSASDRQRFMEQFTSSNQEIAERFLGRKDKVLFYEKIDQEKS